MNRLLVTLMLALAFAISFVSLAHSQDASKKVSQANLPSTSDQSKPTQPSTAAKKAKKKVKAAQTDQAAADSSQQQAQSAASVAPVQKSVIDADQAPDCTDANHCKQSSVVTADETYFINMYTDGNRNRVTVTSKNCSTCKFGDIKDKTGTELQTQAQAIVDKLTGQAKAADKEVAKVTEKEKKAHDEKVALCKIDEKDQKITSRTERVKCLLASLKNAESSDDETASSLVDKIQNELGKEVDNVVKREIAGNGSQVDDDILSLLKDSDDPRAQRVAMASSNRVYDSLLKASQDAMAQYYQLKASGNYGAAWAALNQICPMGQSSCTAASTLAHAAQFAHDIGVKFADNVNNNDGDSKFTVSSADTAFVQRFSNVNKDGNYLLTTIGQERNLPQIAAAGRALGANGASGDNPFSAAMMTASTSAASGVDLGTKSVPSVLLFDSRGNATLRVIDQNSPWGAYNPRQYSNWAEPSVTQIDANAQLRPLIGTGAASATANPIAPNLSIPSATQQQVLPQSLRGNTRSMVLSSTGDSWLL